MKKLLPFLAGFILLLGCASEPERKFTPGATYTGDLYKLLILSYSDDNGALGVAVLDRENDDISYEPHPSQQHVKTFEGMGFKDATDKAREILNRHCGFFTFSSTLLATPENIPTGYEIRPVIKETAHCRVGKQASLIYTAPVNGTVVIRLPEREALPYTPAIQILK